MVTVARIRTGQPTVQALTPSRKGVPLPEGYVPPDPTHPLYGYLTPDELEAYEAEERARLGIVPGVAEPSATEVESQPATVPWAPPSASGGGKHGAESGPLSPPLVSEVPVTEAEEATVAHTCWVPEPPPELRSAVTVAPAAEPAVTPGAMGEYSSDTYRQEWVRATSRAPDAVEEPLPDVAAAAGERGASSSWTTADGQRSAGTRGRSAGSPSPWKGRASRAVSRCPREVSERSAGSPHVQSEAKSVVGRTSWGDPAVWRERGPCSTLVPAREWRNGRRAGFRCQCPQGRGGSNPPSRTTVVSQDIGNRVNLQGWPCWSFRAW
jgi:hypothetical protein